jgi:centromere/kinetochore protein ZW10
VINSFLVLLCALIDVPSIMQEASIADISYLFEEGALVDFQVDELVKLVRALFADTPLRTSTINKLLGGHV